MLACTIERAWKAHRHEKVAIYVVNLRISNDGKNAGIAKQWSIL